MNITDFYSYNKGNASKKEMPWLKPKKADRRSKVTLEVLRI